ncbi:hypothetical protein ASC77_25060 [Nocardioides sp. Root1257]|uniref:PRC-barrel domain-containing protein n=1 Tax=unclassified Nocardioides TaxID=2615069 RepID=UPI0006F334F2|nr:MULTISPECIES: PRC-barrel domain-containing protein [unclassified Nocardioides]KQW50931.1 hypothetical protein ASC77_25060 [Nocardioides sp. Root1257]KRC53727.1 hypothetical protein ASE24_24850 [Nocardioides sp. Root224]
MIAPTVELAYLASTDLQSQLLPSTPDLRGMVVVDPHGLRLGEVADLVIDVAERRPRLISVLSGGLLGLTVGETLVPVEAIEQVDGRVRIAWSSALAHAHLLHHLTHRAPGRPSGPEPGSHDWLTRVTTAYEAFGIRPFWESDGHVR